jgi:hypothetical protein
MTNELCKHVDIGENVWEPAAGRGDMSLALRENGHEVYSSDIDMSEFNYDIGPGHEKSFLDETEIPHGVDSIVTNPPYSEPWRGIADDFVEHALKLFEESGVPDWTVAMLLRSEFKSGKSQRRRLKFGQNLTYYGELVLTTRPRWDYGDPDAPENAAPRHNFSWFLWKQRNSHGRTYPIQIFSYMPKGFKP